MALSTILIIGAAGLLTGRKATTHWLSHELLAEFGATPVSERVVVDGNLVTGAGVTAGIDFALTLGAKMFGDDLAKKIELGIEYDPKPPFDSGSPKTADPSIVEATRTATESLMRERRELVERAAAKLV